MIEFFYDSCRTILLFLLPGVFLGVIYDIFRILRIARTRKLAVSGAFYEKIRPKKALFPSFSSRFSISKSLKIADTAVIFAEDILFWLLAATTEILFFFHTNNGEIRIYSVLISILGFFLYHHTVGVLVISCAAQLVFLCRCLIYWIFYVILYPLKFFIKWIKQLYMATFGRWIYIAKSKKKRNQSEKQKRSILEAASHGFAVYGNKKFCYEEENEYFC